jgi:hypothetical protein
MNADFADETQILQKIESELFKRALTARFICVSSAKSAFICVQPFDMLGGLAAKKTTEITKPLLSRG